jgi:hypothetical protein
MEGTKVQPSRLFGLEEGSRVTVYSETRDSDDPARVNLDGQNMFLTAFAVRMPLLF